MIIRKTYFPEKNFFEGHKKNLSKKMNQKGSKSFQKELFDALEYLEPRGILQKEENLELEIKKHFIGEIIRKDHLFSGSLTDTQKELLIRISNNFY